MRLAGDLTITCESRERADDLARLLQVDNEIAPKTLKVKTVQKGNMVVTSLESEKARTFFATMDDLLFSEKLITDLLNL
jgi:hypothetical protein